MLPPSNRLQWQFVDSVLTDRNGRLNYSIPGEKVSEKGVYALKYLVKLAYQLCICVSTIRFLLPPSPSPHRGDHTTADCNMFALPAATEAILFSFDGALAAKFSLGARDIQIRPEAVEVVRWDLLHTGDGQGTGGVHALVGAMLLWGPCHCGGHAIVGTMLLWGPCYCNGHAIVGGGGGGGGGRGACLETYSTGYPISVERQGCRVTVWSGHCSADRRKWVQKWDCQTTGLACGHINSVNC